jgi:hypothetical protein
MDMPMSERPSGQEAQQERGSPASPGFVMERFGRISDMDRSFDIEYWQRQADAAIYRAAWELIELYHRDQGKGPHELRLQRSIESFQRG